MSEKLRCGGLVQLFANNTIDCVNGGGFGSITGNIGEEPIPANSKKIKCSPYSTLEYSYINSPKNSETNPN